MASVYTKNGHYYARWKDHAGKWRHTKTVSTTKREAERFAVDLERKAERQRAGLEPLPTAAPRMTFADLFEWWWSEYGSKLRGEGGSFLRTRLVPKLGPLALADVSAARIEGLLQGYAGELAPKTLNMLRAALHTIFAKATRRGLWQGLNPAAMVERRKVPRRVYETLRVEEVGPLLFQLRPEWRPLFACAIWTGMRKGELLGLRKADVSLEEGTITVRRSYDSDTTKGGHADVIPIAAPLRPFLADAFASAPQSDLVFPAADGSMRSKETPLELVLRRALGRAGVVDGYDHVCRRPGCGYVERQPDNEVRRCPECRKGDKAPKLWPKAAPRPLRFHDLRGTTGTLLARAGVPLVVAQRILRHADPRLTANVYTRVDLDDLRQGLNRIGGGDSDALQALVATLSPTAAREKVEGRSPVDFSKETAPFQWSGRQDLNLRPLGPERVQSAAPSFAPDRTGSPEQERGADPEGLAAMEAGRASRNDAGLVASLSPALGLAITDVTPESLLSVADVAEVLGLSRATVYALCDAGKLTHVRIGNSIRFRRAAIDAAARW